MEEDRLHCAREHFEQVGVLWEIFGLCQRYIIDILSNMAIRIDAFLESLLANTQELFGVCKKKLCSTSAVLVVRAWDAWERQSNKDHWLQKIRLQI